MIQATIRKRPELLWRGQGEQVPQWRFDRLRGAGYPPGDAVRLAERSEIDLHRAVDLLKSGCPVDTALHILL